MGFSIIITINKAGKYDHVGGSCTWSRATRGQSHTAEILSRSVSGDAFAVDLYTKDIRPWNKAECWG